MDRLPLEIVLDILSRLPVESVLDCKLVSKSLLSLFTTRREIFAKMHHHRQLLQLADGCESAASASSTVNTGLLFSLGSRVVGLGYEDKCSDEMNIHDNFCYKKLKVSDICRPHTGWNYSPKNFLVGSCNGLVCLHIYDYEPRKIVCICNPITGEYVILPEYNLCHEYLGVIGFGYVVHSPTNYEYKVVSYYPKDCVNGEVQVYTIGSGRGWRTKSTTFYDLMSPNPVGVFANGSLYWIQESQDEDMDIVAFSLEDEEFRLVQSVPFINPSDVCCDYELLALGGKLCLCEDRYLYYRLVIWSLNKNGMKESWTRDFSIAYRSINQPGGMLPLLVTKKNEVILLHRGSTVYCYDPKTTSLIQLWRHDRRTTKMFRAFPHMNSFISLKSLGEDSKMQ